MHLANKFILLVAASAVLASCSSSGGQSRLADSAGALGAPDPVNFAVTQTEEYKISPQDRLSVSVYPVREYSIPSVRVAGDGTIFVPPMGQLNAQGKTPPALAAEIQAGLTACCLRTPQVVVQVEETISRRLTVTGAVTKANVYDLRGRTTLLQAISMAGGADPATANAKRVGIIRSVNGQRTGKIFNLYDIQAGRAEDPEVFGGDQIIVDSSDSKNAWRTLLQAVPAAGFFAVF